MALQGIVQRNIDPIESLAVSITNALSAHIP
jgi:hypothetical protein